MNKALNTTIADDDNDLAQRLAALLQPQGYQVYFIQRKQQAATPPKTAPLPAEPSLDGSAENPVQRPYGIGNIAHLSGMH